MSVLRPMPFSLLPTFLIKYIMYLCLYSRARTCFFSISSLFSHCSHSKRVSMSIIQSSRTPLWLKLVGFVFFVIFLPLSSSFPCVDAKTAAIFNRMPRYSLAVTFPPFIPLPNLVFGKSRSLWRENNSPYSLDNALILSSVFDVSPTCSKNILRTY